LIGKSRTGLRVTLASAVALGFALFGACQTPTSVTFALRTDIDCATTKPPRTLAHVLFGNGGNLESKDSLEQPSSTKECVTAAAGKLEAIGTVVALPSDDESAKLAMIAVLGVDRATGSCGITPDDEGDIWGGCIVARRQLSFIEGEALTVDVPLYFDCVGVPCDQVSTCVPGRGCVSSEVDSTECIEASCGEEGLGTGSSSSAAATTGASSSEASSNVSSSEASSSVSSSNASSSEASSSDASSSDASSSVSSAGGDGGGPTSSGGGGSGGIAQGTGGEGAASQGGGGFRPGASGSTTSGDGGFGVGGDPSTASSSSSGGGGTTNSSASSSASSSSGGGGTTNSSASVSSSGGGVGGGQGLECSDDAQCGSNNCEQGICCDRECTGCEACRAVLTNGVDGVCSNVVADLDPNGACFGPCATCEGDGTCTPLICSCGNDDTVCDECTPEGLISQGFCDSNSMFCSSGGPVVVCNGNFRCVDDACLTDCTNDWECVFGSCSMGSCQ